MSLKSQSICDRSNRQDNNRCINCGAKAGHACEKRSNMFHGMFSDKYLEWVRQSGLPPLTNNQHKMAEMLLKKENAKIVSQNGGMEDVFVSVRKFLRKS